MMEHICHTVSDGQRRTEGYKSKVSAQGYRLVSFCNSFHEFFLVSMSFSDVHISSRIPITSAMAKDTMFAVSRTVSPWAIWEISFHQDPVLQTMKVTWVVPKRTYVELLEDRFPLTTLGNTFVEILFSWNGEHQQLWNSPVHHLFVPCPEEIVVVHFWSLSCLIYQM